MDIDEISQFLISANNNGYGNNNIKPVDETDGSHTITYSDGDLTFHDNYFGGESFGGREVISFKNKAVWMMVYYGFVTEMSLQNQIYAFLKESLLLFTPELPYRGPESHENGDWIYENKVTGDFNNFKGEEIIYFKNNEVYRTSYQGGFVDKKS